ncbi:glycosyltransferase family 1 protein [Flavobacterium cellulosilyticum]|uniref:Glycosyltransferase family 1 protein n=2 Tax=Flavobacterium cellulosilyticum TaxID=2541731 RepID=A0A4R5CJ82_9FLAO|nr:glycosyltransferase family 1 protein [Flavobacterium cellulosilyticum]
MMRKKIIRITTVPISLEKLLENQLRYMKQYYDVIAVSSDAPYLEKVGLMQEVPVFSIEMTRKITPIQDVIAVWRLYRFFKNEKPFIVHTHTPKAGTLGMIAAKLAGVPHRLHTIAGLPLLETTGNKRKLLDLVEKWTYAAATMIYPNSFGLKEIIIQEKFCKPEKLKVIGNGSSNGINTTIFNPDLFSPTDKANLKSELGISSDDFVFIFVGRLVGDKGINELVAAFQKMEVLHPSVKLLLVGSKEVELDPLQSETSNQINSNPNIISVGHQNDVRPYFAVSNVLVFPSYREGFPNVVMQAGAMGLASIVTNINGCNEIVESGKNGLIIPVKNESALLNAMIQMFESPNNLHEMRSNARPMIVLRYQQEVVWKAILSEYNKLE